MNLHAPERQQDESQAEYRARQRVSRTAVALVPAGAYTSSKLTPKHRVLLLKIAARRANTGQRPKFAKVRRHKAASHALRDALGAITLTGNRIHFIGVPRDPRYFEQGGSSDGDWFGRRIWRAGEPVHTLNPNRERDPGKRETPKSAVAKRMDRPERVAAMERGHAKLMRFFGA